jgi:hypothetical protein
MSAGLWVLVILTCLTWFNLAIQWYTQVGTYALLPAVADASDDAGFVRYHLAYQRRLPATVLVPYGLLMVTSVLFQFVHPAGVGLFGRLLVLLLNLVVAVVSVGFAAGAHKRMDKAGAFDPAGGKALLRYNAIRLVAMFASGITVIVLLASTVD